MSVRVDTASLIAGAVVCGNRGLGIFGSIILATTGEGTDGGGVLLNDFRSGDENKELRALITTAPPAGGVLVMDEDGTFIYTGPPGSFNYQLRVGGVDVGTPVPVTLYGGSNAATPANSNSGASVSSSNAIQTYRATPAGAQGGATVASTNAVQVQLATPANAQAGASVSPSNATQTYRSAPASSNSGATVTSTTASQGMDTVPANSNSGATVESTTATQTYRAIAAAAAGGATVSPSNATQTNRAEPAASNSGAQVTAATATQTHLMRPADSVSGATVRSTRAIVLNLGLTSPMASYPDTLQSAEYPVQ